MATYRVGIGSFNLKDGAVGIGTESTGLGNLKVEGTYKTTDLDVTGVSTFTRYAGFAPDNLEIGKDSRDVTLTGEHSTQGDIVVGVNSTFTVSTGATVTVGTVPSVSIGTHFSPPTGGIEDRPEVPVEGMVRFNTDLNTLEFYNGVEWRQFTVSGSSGRGILGGAYNYPVILSNIDYINIPTKGNSLNFGELSENLGLFDAAGSSTRMVFSGAYKAGSPYIHNDMEYITIAAKGNSIDFGSLSSNNNTYGTGACSSSTRMLIPGGNAGSNVGTNIISYIQINTLGDATDFGDLVIPRGYPGGTGSSVRAIIVGNYSNDQGVGGMYTAETVNYASKGNAITFGDMTEGGFGHGASNSVRSIYGGTSGGSNTYTNNIDYVNIASLGNGQSFGERTTYGIGAAMSSGTRVVMTGGKLQDSPYTVQDIMDYVEITTSGNAADFGDAGFTHSESAGSSDCHGGLGGY